MQAYGLSDLLFNEIVPVATYLKVVLHPRLDSHDGFAYRPHRPSRQRVYSGIHVELIEDQDLFLLHLELALTLEDAEEQTISKLVVVDGRLRHRHFLLLTVILVIAASGDLDGNLLGLFEDNEDLIKD